MGTDVTVERFKGFLGNPTPKGAPHPAALSATRQHQALTDIAVTADCGATSAIKQNPLASTYTAVPNPKSKPPKKRDGARK